MNTTSKSVLLNTGKLKPLKVLVRGVPESARLSAGVRRDDGAWELAPRELDRLRITPPRDSDADIELAVLLVTEELLNGSIVESVEIRHLHVEVEATLDFASKATRPGLDNSLSFV